MSVELLDLELQSADVGTEAWMVVIYNNDTTSVDDVVEILMRATQCDQDEAFIEMWEAHNFGKASVHFAGRSVCDDVASIIQTVGVKAEVMKEWND